MRRVASVRFLLLALVSTVSIEGVAEAAMPAPGLSSGPKIVSGGLLWAGPNGVSLSSSTRTRLLVAEADLSEVLMEGAWTVLARPSGPKVGRAGVRFSPVRGLRRCRPMQGKEAGAWTVAVAGGDLYAIAQARCLARRPAEAQFLVRVRLGTGTAEAIGRVRSGAISLAAAGGRLALTYKSGVRGPVRVDVVSSSNAKLLYSVTEPLREQGGGYGRLETQIDSKGDVLVTDPPFRREAFGWWGNAAVRVGRLLHQTGFIGASLSAGRIAYVSGRGGVEHIDVLNLTTRKTRTEVTFPGSARVLGVGLGKTRVAWAQQSIGYVTRTDFHSCVETVSVGSPELAQTPLSASGPPIVVKGVPVTPATGPRCARP
ncbi:MAG TPA: hypothetical protein VGW98_10105 [Solirubrobacteraceae bacterium]|jgi:hypothetical protein|nr:hypothetical protein [Solirubrobacteraceae bacterium]